MKPWHKGSSAYSLSDEQEDGRTIEQLNSRMMNDEVGMNYELRIKNYELGLLV
jgi:hypothetical protein